MDAVLRPTVSNAFYSMKIFDFKIKFHLNVTYELIEKKPSLV